MEIIDWVIESELKILGKPEPKEFIQHNIQFYIKEKSKQLFDEEIDSRKLHLLSERNSSLSIDSGR